MRADMPRSDQANFGQRAPDQDKVSDQGSGLNAFDFVAGMCRTKVLGGVAVLSGSSIVVRGAAALCILDMLKHAAESVTGHRMDLSAVRHHKMLFVFPGASTHVLQVRRNSNLAEGMGSASRGSEHRETEISRGAAAIPRTPPALFQAHSWISTPISLNRSAQSPKRQRLLHEGYLGLRTSDWLSTVV
jgi:hypothetical protein